jgi:hypothetical protein
MTRAIDEWQPLWQTPVLNWLPWGVAVVGVVWMWRCRTSDRVSIGLTLVMLACASARVMRIESLFITASVILLARALAARWPASAGFGPAHVLVIAATGLLLAAIPASVLTARQAVSCVPILAAWAPDLEAMAALAHAGPGRIVTPFNWGQYAIWHLPPGLRVSMDGRRETVYSAARLDEADAVMTGQPAGLAALAAWRVEYVWLPTGTEATAAWLVENGYRLDVQTPGSVIAVRSDLPRLPAAPAPGSIRPCFPG